MTFNKDFHDKMLKACLEDCKTEKEKDFIKKFFRAKFGIIPIEHKYVQKKEN